VWSIAVVGLRTAVHGQYSDQTMVRIHSHLGDHGFVYSLPNEDFGRRNKR
jgi:hypothetical protein